jgi:DNA-binding NarL/FixJ family response regulator
MPKSTRIFVVEDTHTMESGLEALLGEAKGFKFCGSASSGLDAVAQLSKLKPNLVLIDMRMAQMEGIQACKLIRKKRPSVKIIMITEQESESEIFAALTAGADGYCLKESTTEKLYTAIRSVAEGDFWLDSTIARKVVKTLLETMSVLSGESEPASEKIAVEDLSRRELQVLTLVAQGLSNNEIADRLDISVDAVKSRIRKIMKKLVATDRTEMAVKALRQGLI